MEVSIERYLARGTEETHPVARRLAELPRIGFVVRAWTRATRTLLPKDRWVSLPPVVA